MLLLGALCFLALLSTSHTSCTSVPNKCQNLDIKIPAREGSVGYYNLNMNLNNTKAKVLLSASTFSGGWYKYYLDYLEGSGSCPGKGSLFHGTFSAYNNTPVINLNTGILTQNPTAFSLTLQCDDVLEACEDTFQLCIVYMP
jgi:hypothetical protein